ncbi:MAG: hypothetical protein QNL24_13610 [Akkermansiaceae bacterium]
MLTKFHRLKEGWNAPIWRIKASFVSKYRGEGCPRSRSTNCSIQGRSDKLKPLLNTLSYRHNGTSFANSDAHRTTIFLGDLIDPKNDYLPNGTSEVLHSERDMVSACAAPKTPFSSTRAGCAGISCIGPYVPRYFSEAHRSPSCRHQCSKGALYRQSMTTIYQLGLSTK